MNSGVTYTADELISNILRYKSYFDNSGGGVTVSGGEPLLQVQFVTELFKKLKELNIHTALDTSGNFPISKEIKELLNYTDLVLLDIKHINNEKCINLTGVPNTKTLEFAKYLSNNSKDIWIRQVLVPGYTDDKFDLQALKKFIETLSSVKKIEILPYHDLGKFKWKELGQVYALDKVSPPSKEEIDNAKRILGIL